MTPDSVLSALSERVAKVEQRVADLMDRIVERFDDVAEDIRRFAPLVLEHADMRADIRGVAKAVDKLTEQQEKLEARFETERDERIAGQAERKEELQAAIIERKTDMERTRAEIDKQNKELRNRLAVAALALLGVFLAAAANFAAQLLNQGSHP